MMLDMGSVGSCRCRRQAVQHCSAAATATTVACNGAPTEHPRFVNIDVIVLLPSSNSVTGDNVDCRSMVNYLYWNPAKILSHRIFVIGMTAKLGRLLSIGLSPQRPVTHAGVKGHTPLGRRPTTTTACRRPARGP